MISEVELARLSDSIFNFDAASSWYNSPITSHLGTGLKPGSIVGSDPIEAAFKLHTFNECSYDTQASINATAPYMAGTMSQNTFQPRATHALGYRMTKNDLIQVRHIECHC
jgi:hypothetical protein